MKHACGGVKLYAQNSSSSMVQMDWQLRSSSSPASQSAREQATSANNNENISQRVIALI